MNREMLMLVDALAREKGVAPAQMTGFNPQSGLSRPLCPYPQFAKYKGTGNIKDAANWACAPIPT